MVFNKPSISVTLHEFVPDLDGEDCCAFVYRPLERRCNVPRDGHKLFERPKDG